MRTQGVKNVCRPSAAAGNAVDAAPGEGGRSAPLRVDAQRNLEHVLRAAREVFGELGYGAPMEDVARRAKVGVGTVYRRFPSKEVLVRRIAAQETARLTEQARQALEYPGGAWEALSTFLRASVASGAGRLLPPHVLRVGQDPRLWPSHATDQHPSGAHPSHAVAEPSDEVVRLPQQRRGNPTDGRARDAGETASAALETSEAPETSEESEDAGAAQLLSVVGQLVDRARRAGELREDVSVADVLLVIATAAPALPDAGQQSAASERLLDILLAGLRSRRDG